VLATNPAAIGVFTTSEFSGSVSAIFPSVDVSGQITSTMPTEAGDVVIASEEAFEDDIADTAVIPSFFYVTPLNEKWSVGVGAFSTYGLRSDYGDDFEALHFADTAEVESFTINPAVSYKVNDMLRVGFGLNITYADAEISSALPNSLTTVLGLPVANASVFKLEGDDIGYGWNAGIFYQPTNTTNIALSYRAETKLELDGEVSSALSAELNQPGSLDLNLASITELAISQDLDDQWSVQASLVFTDWSTFQKLEANLASGDDFLIKEENFDDSLRASIGVTYVLNDAYTLRAGYAYDDGVVTVENRSLSIPDTDRHWVTGGVTYSMTEATTIDLAYAYINGREADINKTRSLGSTGISSTMVGSQSATAHVLSVQVNTRF
jgi:long-chain fatty acid transport protein